MKNELVSKRYARALLDLAAESNQVDEIGAALTAVATLVRASPELRHVLVNPVFKGEGREEILGQLQQRMKLPDAVYNVLSLLSERNRLALVEEIAESYRILADDRGGRVRVAVTSAVALRPEEQTALRKTLEGLIGKKSLVLELAVDPSLLAGMVTRIGDRLYDGSLTTHLKAIRQRLEEAA